MTIDCRFLGVDLSCNCIMYSPYSGVRSAAILFRGKVRNGKLLEADFIIVIYQESVQWWRSISTTHRLIQMNY